VDRQAWNIWKPGTYACARNRLLTFPLPQVQTASFILRVLSFPQHGLLPSTLTTSLQEKAPKFWLWASKVVKEEGVTYIWDEKKVAEGTKTRIAAMKEKAAVAK
jgi:glutathione S-transferase